jgi:hypothetical protein
MIFRSLRSRTSWVALLLASVALGFTGKNVSVWADDGQIEFNRDIRPILSDNCFACHGPDAMTRQGGLRLDQAEDARAKSDSGKIALVPHKPDESELVRRIVSDDANSVMPPAESGKHLTAHQIDLLKRWVAQGAPYQRHWSLVTPTRPRLELEEITGALGPIDVFVRNRLRHEGLTPNPPADPERLIRRITLDLTGTPPTLEDVDEFLADRAPDAYEKVVDRLLASPRYGERVTVDWLDAARFADTHGFNNDTTRSMWRWRDWTINAFNANMPFDQFLTEQLAGDLLPDPTLDQLIATGFNRNHVINSEGGIIPEEYRVEYVADRVHTTATVFLGLSMGCVRCHDHKFDPITQREYYQFFAFFNQLDEKGEDGRRGNAEPRIQAPTPEQAERKAAMAHTLEWLKKAIDERLQQQCASVSEGESRLREVYQPKSDQVQPIFRFPLNESAGDVVWGYGNSRLKGTVIGKLERVAGKLDGAIKFDGNTQVEFGDAASFERTDKFSQGAWVNVESKEPGAVIARMDSEADYRGFDLQLERGKLTAHLIHRWPDNSLQVVTKSEVPLNQWTHVFMTYDGSSKAEGLKLYINGQVQNVEVKQNRLTDTTITSKPLRVGRRSHDSPFKGAIDEVRIYDRELSADEVQSVFQYDGIPDLLDLPASARTPQQTEAIAQSVLFHFDQEFQSLNRRQAEQNQLKAELENAIPSAMVMREMAQPRPTYFLKRGQYDAHGDEVQPGVPASLPPFPADVPRNRLGLAQWMLLPDHPLTSRVAVNRKWALFFGNGLVETVEDFGSQGQWPSHLDLLDWLAVEFSGHGGNGSKWDGKRLDRSIVLSATYRQSSRLSPELLERDPLNRLLSHGARFRLQAEAIRDNALAIAGLLSDRTGGPSVSPYQPEGLWDDVAVGADYEGTVYKLDKGEGLYRRSMYTFWKRTCPPPGLNTFDAPEREFCMARRSRTNTPLQALVLMNDPTYLEAARKLAERAITAGGSAPEARVAYAFRTALSRKPTAGETEILLTTYRNRLANYQQNTSAAKSMLSIGASPHDTSINEAELAAWTSVMSVILNMDEAITKG